MLSWNSESREKELAAWVANPTERRLQFESPSEKIRATLAQPSERNIAFVAAYLRHLHVWTGKVGALTVLRGRINGWSDITLSAMYLYWHLRILIHLYDRNQRRAKPAAVSMKSGALCFFHLLVSGAVSEALWVGNRLVADFPAGAFGHWPNTPLEPFAIRLSKLVQGHRAPADRLPLTAPFGPYQSILHAWTDSAEALRDSLMSICDYHIARTDDPEDAGYPEFFEPLYDVFPAEVLGVYEVRRLVGLATPRIEHPLMNTLLATPPSGLSPSSCELLDAVIQSAKSLLPEAAM
jgi:hypothetical protein